MASLNRTKIGGVKATYSTEIQVEWEIPDFSSLPDQRGLCYESPIFSLADTSWCLELAPGGGLFIPSGFISLRAVSEDKKASKKPQFTFGIKKADGKIEEWRGIFGLGPAAPLFWKPPDYFDRALLLQRKSELMPSGVLTVTCHLKLETHHEMKAADRTVKLIKLETLSQNFKDLLTSEKNCDAEIEVKGKKFPVHRSVLIDRSSVFAAMFQNNMSEKETGVISISDCDPDSFGEFLEFVYSGKAESITFSSALHLHSTADKYDVQELKSFCVEYMKQNLTPEVLCDVVTLADQYDETQLFSAAQDFFNKNMTTVFETPDWDVLNKKKYHLVKKLLAGMALKVKVQE